MNIKGRIVAVLLGVLALWPAARGFAAEDYPRKGFSLGPRFSMTKPDDGGDWVGHGGLQARLHMTRIWALEGSADYRRRRVGGTRVDIYPVQASLIAHLLPNPSHISPFLLAGAGWYYTHIDSPTGSDTSHRFGPHVGGGVQLFLNDKWSVDGTYRHYWLEKIHSSDPNVLNRDFSDDGHQVTAALNYHF